MHEYVTRKNNLTNRILVQNIFPTFFNTYRKRQKLSRKKVSRFTEFHPNAGKTFAVLLQSAPIAHSIWRESIRGSSKIHKNREALLSRSFCHLWYMTHLNTGADKFRLWSIPLISGIYFIFSKNLKSFYHLCTLMFLFEMCVCLHMEIFSNLGK